MFISVYSDDPVPISSISSDKFYVVGNFNDWGGKFGTAHTYEGATAGDKYYLGSTPVIEGNYAVYEVDIGQQEIGNYEAKIIAVNDSSSGEIDYNRSWGAANSEGVTSGSDKAAFSFSTDHVYYLSIVFKYDLTDATKSVIQYKKTAISDDTTITSVQVGFLNKQLENVNEPHDKTNFATPWSDVYVTYTTPRGLKKDVVVDLSTETNGVVWTKIPSDAYDVYFSNMKFEFKDTDGYQYTEKLPNSRVTNNYPIYVPVTSEEDSKHNVQWKFGEADFYRSYTNSIEDYHTPANTEMTWVGSYQTNYYNVPLVNLLEEILYDQKNLKGAYAFSAYPYTSDMTVDGQSCVFSRSKFITYQGENYFYIPSSTGYSYLICQGSTKSGGGYLKENEFALEAGAWDDSHTRMENRQGAIFTSNGSYYDGSKSAHSYNGYTPNWYTIKLPVTDEFTIENITGVVSDGYKVIESNSSKTKVAKAGDYFNRPVYIYYDKDYQGNTSVKTYTYDTEFGSVDTNKEGKVTVYLNKPSDWSDNVKVNAYSIIGSGANADMELDTTDSTSGRSFYKFTFDAGQYCFFRFYDKDDPGKTTDVMTLTGEENENREYRILCNAANGNLKEFEFYLHPKTKALYAWQDARAAKYATDIPRSYTYDASGYHAEPSSPLKYLGDLETNAYNYYNGSGPWSDEGASDYHDKALAARTFAAAIKKARIYIACDPTVATDPVERSYIFPEKESRDEILSYEPRWVSSLRFVHDEAMKLYEKPATEDITGSLYAYADEIERIIQFPETILNPEAIQIIVDNQPVYQELFEDPSDPTKVTSTVKNGDWDIGKIRLYTKDSTNTIKEAALKLYDTTQSSEGFYAYVFMAKKFQSVPTDPLKFNVGQVTDIPTEVFDLTPGTTYIYHTATGEFEEDKAIHTITCVYNVLEKGGRGDAYGKYVSKNYGDKINLMFLYDTEVNYDSKTYKIMAGAYTISGAYSHFTTDFSGQTGINLFTDAANQYFSKPKICGLTGSTTLPDYTTYSASQSGGGNDLDIVADGLSGGAALEFETDASTGRVNFRWSNVKSSTGSNADTLSLPSDVSLKAGVATVAVNNLILNGHEFHIEAKKVTFYCDTKITTSAGTFTISHGTYLFNNLSGSATLVPIDLSTTGTAHDWRKSYILVEEVKTDLGGGKFVVK